MPLPPVYSRFLIVDEDHQPMSVVECQECSALIVDAETHDNWHRRTWTESPTYPQGERNE